MAKNSRRERAKALTTEPRRGKPPALSKYARKKSPAHQTLDAHRQVDVNNMVRTQAGVVVPKETR